MSTYPAQTPMDAAPQKSRGRLILFIVLGVLVALLAFGGIAYALAGRFLGAQHNTPALLPESTQFYASINPSLSSLPGIQRLQKSFQQGDDETVTDFNKQLEDTLGVNFQQDIQPWIGLEMAIAVDNITSFDPAIVENADEIPSDGDVTVLLASRDDAKAQAFLDKVRAKAEADRGMTFSTEDYKGVTITTGSGNSDGPNGAYAIAQNHVVFASKAESIKALIDRGGNTQGSLAESAGYKQTMAGLPSDALGYVFLNGATIRDAMNTSLEQQLSNLPSDNAALRDQIEQQKAALDALYGLGLSVTVPNEGVQFDTAVKFDMTKVGDALKQQFAAGRGALNDATLKYVAKDALGFAAIPIPDTFREQVEKLVKSTPDAEEQIQAFEQQFDLDFEKDVLGWISGEFALVVTPGDAQAEGALSSAPVSGYLLVRSKDMATAKTGLPKIAKAIESVAGMSFAEQQINGLAWQAVSDPEANTPLAGYALTDDAVLFGFAEAGMNAAAGSTKAPITDDETFKAARAKASDPLGGMAFIDVQDAINAAVQFQGQTREEFDATESGKAFKSITSVVGSGQPGVGEDGMMKARLFVAIQPQQ